MNDEDGFDLPPPPELEAWLESKKKDFDLGHYILVNGKIKKVTFLEWAKWFSDFDQRVIDRTEIKDLPAYPSGDFISTIFLGLDHGSELDDITNESLPVLFESMVFGGKFDQRGWRYSSYGEAKRGHWIIVDQIRAGEPPNVPYGERPFMEMFFDMFREEEDEQ